MRGTVAGVLSTLLAQPGALAVDRPRPQDAPAPRPAEPPLPTEKITLENVHASHFKSCLNSVLELTDPSGARIPLELAEVSERYTTAQLENYSIIFQGPPQPVLAQQIYPITHAQLGELTLFLVPIGRNEQGVRYEAVFNRLIG
jgi:hypothetical protein